MLPPAVGAFENPRSSRELISQPPGAPDAREPVGPTQLRQCGDARRLIAIAINECEKSGHYRPLPPPQDRCRIRARHEHIKNVTTHPALTGEGGKTKSLARTILRSAQDINERLKEFVQNPDIETLGKVIPILTGMTRDDVNKIKFNDLGINQLISLE